MTSTKQDLTRPEQQMIDVIVMQIQNGTYTMDDIIIQEVVKNHLTLQQAFIANLGRMIILYAEKCKYSDDRNKNAIRFATAVADLTTKDPSLMPFI